MKFLKLASKAVSGAIQLGRKVKKEDVDRLGKKAMNAAKTVEGGLSEDNIQNYSDKAKNIGSRITDSAGRAASVADTLGNVANAIGFSAVGKQVHSFAKQARSVHEKGKKAGKLLGYTKEDSPTIQTV